MGETTETQEKKKKALRPRDAATLIVYRRDVDAVRLLMGRRAMGHVFMPGALVFPGGRIENQDRFVPVADELDPAVVELLCRRSSASPARARALALAAIRETYEETGYLIGIEQAAWRKPPGASWSSFVSHGVLPALSRLRLLTRAITPPTQPRRFDARFFVVEADAIVKQVEVPDEELENPAWVTFDEARAFKKLPMVTRVVLDELEPKLVAGPLEADAPVVLRRMRQGKFQSEPI
ncbi:NUDIX hydrolase [Oryzicola mucosus]|uniref:NUDIX domain-containing protein n=1 Tax=Oryzicola mucosus TaxID=2767425 RepID=A0A8J6U9J0_9HYPH|nr:NUDIX domain-containing protein [Oryzicola mucosus]MBD0417372.1 NUDIX domain-containing protein [Oryzicola mucosus]